MGEIAMSKICKEAGNRIRILREKENLSREFFSELTGISPKFLYEIETGKKGFSAENTAQNRPEFCRQSGLNAQKIRLVYDAFLQHFTGHREGRLIFFLPVKLFLCHGCLLSGTAPLCSRRGNNTSVSGSHSSEIPARNGRR